MSVQIWTPGAAGPLDEFVGRITRMAAAFAQEYGLAQAEVRIELIDGSRHVLLRRPEPGFGFSPVPHEGGEEPRVIVPVGALKLQIWPDPDGPSASPRRLASGSPN
jgi:hypothetical protein